MNPFQHRVKRGPEPKLFVLPPQQRIGRTFIDADGTEMIVTCFGKMVGPFWPEGISVAKDAIIPARIHLPRVR